jgi:hypothetical protein
MDPGEDGPWRGTGGDGPWRGGDPESDHTPKSYPTRTTTRTPTFVPNATPAPGEEAAVGHCWVRRYSDGRTGLHDIDTWKEGGKGRGEERGKWWFICAGW